MTAVSRYDFKIAVIFRAYQNGNQNTPFLDTLNCFQHFIIVYYLERMVRERLQLIQRKALHTLLRVCLPFFVCLEQVIIAGELDIFRGTFHAPAPPS